MLLDEAMGNTLKESLKIHGVRIIACIEDRQVINTILAHINRKQEPLASVMAGAGTRAPPTEPRASINQ